MKDLINYLRNKIIFINEMKFRHLELYDYNNNFLDLFKSFSSDINYDKILFDEYYSNYLSSNKVIYVLELNNIILGSISLLFDQKIFHNYNLSIQIEDLVVNKNIRNNKIGSLLLSTVKNLIEEVNTIEYMIYKIILNCDDKLENFYTKNGFIKKGNYMTYYI